MDLSSPNVVVSSASITPATITVPSTVTVTVTSSGRPVMSVGEPSALQKRNNLTTQMKISVSPPTQTTNHISIGDLQNSVKDNRNNTHWLYEKLSRVEENFETRINRIVVLSRGGTSGTKLG